MAREGGFFSPSGSGFSTNKSGNDTQVAGFFSKKKEVPTKKFKGIKGITATKDAINSQTYRDMGDESMADEFKKKYNIDPSDYMNLQSKKFVSPSGNEVGQIASATTDLGGLLAQKDTSDEGDFQNYMKVLGIKRPGQLPPTMIRMLKENYQDDKRDFRYRDGQLFNKAPVNTDTKVAMGDNLGGYAAAIGGLGSMAIMGANAIKNTIQNIAPNFQKKIEQRVNPEENKVSIGDRVGGFLNNLMGISPVAAGTLDANQQVAQVSERPKLSYVNPDAKTMSLSEIGEAFKPKNLFGYKDKFGRFDDPGSPLARDRAETMQRVAQNFSSPIVGDARTIGQIRADQEARMRENARLRNESFQRGERVQQKSADVTYGTNMLSNPAFGFRDKMTDAAKAKYDQSARDATEMARTDPSLGNVAMQTFNRVSGFFGGPQGSLESIGERQLRLANKEINRPTYQKEAYARKMLGITNDQLKARNMQQIRANAEARTRAFNLQKAIKASERSARRLGGNIGTGRDGGFGTGTQGKGLPSNPKGFSGYSRKSSPSSGTGTSTSSSSPSTSSAPSTGINTSRSRRRGSSGGKKGGGGGGGTGGGGGGGGTSSSGTKGGAGRKASKASKGRTGRGRSQCDIRTKIDITSLTNQNLIKDDLATVAYFVQELRGE